MAALVACMGTGMRASGTLQMPHGGRSLSTVKLSGMSDWHPYCKDLVGRLSPHQLRTLREAWQRFMYAEKLSDELGHVIHNAQNPPADEAMRLAWASPLPVEELERRRNDALSAKQEHEASIKSSMEALQRDGVMRADAEMERVAQCAVSVLEPRYYPYRPMVSFVLQYFKRPHMIPQLVEPLRGVATQMGIPAELVVNVDNPHEHREWANLSYSTGGFVVPVFSANVHEIRAYNRGAAIARGDYIVFLQDDQILPVDPVWVKNMVRVFDKYDSVGAIGFMSYRYCKATGRNIYQGDFQFRDEELGLEMTFANVVDFAPLAVRRTAFESIGGLDEGFSDQGVCGIFSDWDMSERLWLDGWHVAFAKLDGKRVDQNAESGTHLPETGERCWQRQAGIVSGLFDERYKPFDKIICDAVRALNLKHLTLRQGAECPFTEGCR